MNFEYSKKVKDLQDKLTNFMNEHVYKNEAVYKEEVEKGGRWCVPKIMEDMKSKAKSHCDFAFDFMSSIILGLSLIHI